MTQQSGKLLINEHGKLILTGEVFDGHGSYCFDGFVDTGSSFSMVLCRGLVDAVCADVIREVNISIGGGTGQTRGQVRKLNFRFGDLMLEDYEVISIGGSRNLIGVQFFQDTGILMMADFHKGKTKGGLITNDRKFASALGKTAHCFSVHKVDITESHRPCSACGANGE